MTLPLSKIVDSEVTRWYHQHLALSVPPLHSGQKTVGNSACPGCASGCAL